QQQPHPPPDPLAGNPAPSTGGLADSVFGALHPQGGVHANGSAAVDHGASPPANGSGVTAPGVATAVFNGLTGSVPPVGAPPPVPVVDATLVLATTPYTPGPGWVDTLSTHFSYLLDANLPLVASGALTVAQAHQSAQQMLTTVESRVADRPQPGPV